MGPQKEQNLGKLWLYSFTLLFKIWWRIAITFSIFCVVGQILTMILQEVLTILGAGAIWGGGDPRDITLFLIGIFLVSFAIIQIYTCYFWSILIQLIYNAIHGKTPSLLEAAGHSFKEAWALFIFSFIISLISLPGWLLIHKIPILGILFCIFLFLFLFIRWIYAQGYIVLQQRGAFESMSSSWDLTRKRYGETVLLGFIILISFLMYWILMVIIATPFVKILSRTTIHFALTIFCGLALGQILSFIIATFVDRDSIDNPRMTPQKMEDWTPPEIYEGDFSDLNPTPQNPTRTQQFPTLDKIE